MKEKLEQLRNLLNEILSLMKQGNLELTNKEEAQVQSDPSFLWNIGEESWIHRIEDGRSFGLNFLENGEIRSLEGVAEWTLNGSELIIRWPSTTAPGGAWLDICKVMPSKREYVGQNQDGVRVSGFLRALKKAPDGAPAGANNEFGMIGYLLDENQWPEAVFSFQMADEKLDAEKEERAEGIANLVLPPMYEKRFLDFGCGEGHVAKFASGYSKTSVGYDIVKSGNLVWNAMSEGFLLTTDLNLVAKEGPYDVILMYDVLDHADEMTKALCEARDLLAENGKIYLRCHPWCSRHGGHLYRDLNKAFLHLVLNSEELSSLGLKPLKNQGVLYPLETYEKAISNSGLVKLGRPEVDTQEVEPFFFNNPLIRSRILRTFGVNEWGENPPVNQMSICFIDYILQKNQ